MIAMIVVIIKNVRVCCQKQLDDYLNRGNIQIRTISRVVQVDIFRTIQSCYRQKISSKKFWKYHTIALRISTLDQFIHMIRVFSDKKNQNSCTFTAHSYRILTLDKYLTFLPNQLKSKTAHHSEKKGKTHIPSVKLQEKHEISIQSSSLIPQTFLQSYPYMHLDRFYLIPHVTQTDFCNHPILAEAWKYYQEMKTFTGLFQHMILLNSFNYWDQVENELRAEGYHPKGFPLVEFIKWEFLRHSMGITSYTDAERIFQNFDKKILAPAFENPTRIPAPYTASYYYKWLKPIHFQTFFQKLVDDCVKYKIIIPRIVIADGLIFRTWAGNFSLDHWMKPTDPGATITVHNKKQLGKCYNAIVFYAWCGNRWLPVDLRVITGSANENAVFIPLVEDFLKSTPYEWSVFLYDSGASSAQNREFLKAKGLVTGITARKNIVHEVVLDVDHRRYCFSEDIPEGMSLEQFKRLLNHRSQEEAGFSGFTTYHHMKQMNRMGQDAAMIHVLKYLILQLMHALAAYKVNRPDLIMMYSAFSALE